MAITTVTVLDGNTAGERSIARTLEFSTARVTTREIIRKRIQTEVEEFNAGKHARFHGLVQPTDTEQLLNAPKSKRQARQIDWVKQFIAALEAFDSSRMIVLIDDRQASDLDEDHEIQAGTEVLFLKLVPLVGG